MEQRKAIVLPKTKKILKQMGEQTKLAGLRIDLSMEVVSERAAISRATLSKIEKGDPSVAIGFYAVVLRSINGIDEYLLLVAKDDVYGRTMQDLKLITRKRVSKN